MLRNINTNEILIEARSRENMGDLVALAASINETGVIQPIAVMMLSNPVEVTEEDGSATLKLYKLLAGGRRIAACEKLKLEVIPCNIFETELTEREALVVELSENLYRKDFDYQEEIRLKKRIFDAKVAVSRDKGIKVPSQSMVAAEVGESKTNFNADLRLAKAMDSMPEIFEKAKNKHEAHKLLDRAQEKAILDEMSRRAAEKVSKSKESFDRWLYEAYVVSDVFEGLSNEPENTYAFVEIDPPYGINYTEQKKASGLSGTDEYHEIDSSEYKGFIYRLLNETKRIAKPDAYVLLWFAMSNYTMILEVARELGYGVQEIPFIWAKANAQAQNNQPRQRMSNVYETALVLSLGKPTLAKSAPRNLLSYNQVASKHKVHPTEKPIELLEDLFSFFALPNSKMISPFLGSGNSILAARNIQVHCHGFDLSEDYRSKYVARVSSGVFKSYKVGD